MTEASQVWAVVVNWNGCADTLACLDSLAQSALPLARVVVVDNGSTDGSVSAIRQHAPDVDTIEVKENLGFGRANNLAADLFLQDSTGTHLFLINNDAIVKRDTLSHLLQAVCQEGVGAAVPKVYYADTPQRLWYAGGHIDWKQGCGKHDGMGQEDKGQFDQPRAVSFATGCGVLLRRTVVEQLDLFDPRYFFLGEDVDLSLRLLRAGHVIWYCPQAVVLHKVGHSLKRQGNGFAYYHMTRNRLLTMRKHARWFHWLRFGLYFPLLWGLQIVKAAVRDGDLAVARGVWRGAWDFATGRFDRRGP